MDSKRFFVLSMVCILIFISCPPRALHAQTRYIFNKAPGCAWDASTSSDVNAYRVFIVRINSVLSDTLIVSTSADSPRVYVVPDSLLTDAFFYFGVSAVDYAGNESAINWAETQCVMFPDYGECWYVLYDVTPPAMPMKLRPPF
jgi:hypothetical protein